MSPRTTTLCSTHARRFFVRRRIFVLNGLDKRYARFFNARFVSTYKLFKPRKPTYILYIHIINTFGTTTNASFNFLRNIFHIRVVVTQKDVVLRSRRLFIFFLRKIVIFAVCAHSRPTHSIIIKQLPSTFRVLIIICTPFVRFFFYFYVNNFNEILPYAF